MKLLKSIKKNGMMCKFKRNLLIFLSAYAQYFEEELFEGIKYTK